MEGKTEKEEWAPSGHRKPWLPPVPFWGVIERAGRWCLEGEGPEGRVAQKLENTWGVLVQGAWRLTGAAARADNFTSKALCVSFQLNVTSLYCSIRNTCVNIPQVLVQKVNGGQTGSVGAENENQ